MSAGDAAPAYAELHCLSAFSFQRGASTADELFERAHAHGYRALAITDECSLAGIVRAWQAARRVGLPLVVGSELRLADGPACVLLVESLAGYQRLCGLITQARRRADKGDYRLLRRDFAGGTDGLLALWLPGAVPDIADGGWLQALFPQRAWLAVGLHLGPDDAARLAQLQALGARLDMPLVAAGDVHMHARGRRALQDTLTAIRHHVPVAEAGTRLFANGERHLRPRAVLGGLYPRALLDESVRIAARCRFDLGSLRPLYQYPRELVPAGHDAASWLRRLADEGLDRRIASGALAKPGEIDRVRTQIDHELALIARKGYENYFLTVHDIVGFARGRGILCQGRGSAANSVVCFALGITEVDPSRSQLLFERFISADRDEPPDIDVDFEHERREEVIQYVFGHYGRHRAALAAVAITWRGAGAVREVARALGMPQDRIDTLARAVGRWSMAMPDDARLREYGFDPADPLLRRVLALTGQLVGLPRHLSQHPGGFVISEHPLDTLVPVENAAMPERTVIQWDKDDLDAVGLLKVDVLALGMLTALRRCFDLLRRHDGPDLAVATIPPEDGDTYDMIGRADTIGVFQIESRAQMAMLPRLRPRRFYDLVIQIAIVRPGPIQGDMVHPYLRRRGGEEPVDYPSPELQAVLRRTLGVPLFQEQVMQIAMVAADFSASEADALRRSMAAWKRTGGLEPHRDRLLAGMLRNGYTLDFAERIFEQIKGFGSYGFPESHAASFALLAYASSWLKCHHPAAFACAMINSWPMGFYSPDQLLQDARRHGIAVRPVDVRSSDWDCTLERTEAGSALPSGAAAPGPATFAIRMGLRMVHGFREADAQRIAAARVTAPFADLADLCGRTALDARARALLADAGALRGLAGHRHRARWAVSGVEAQLPLFEPRTSAVEAPVALPPPDAAADMRADYASTGTTLGPHPLRLLRARLRARRCLESRELAGLAHGRHVRVAGLVTLRQRPQTASGVTFMTLEDEHGMVNVVVRQRIAEAQRRPYLEARLLQVSGRLQAVDGVRHVVAQRLLDLSGLLGDMAVDSRDFH
ncbi:error-prone DNA polymerase [Luteimonas sp. BDR2-5]|uniref:error-prone DNA polymerase n=1 Tax=Proluteimonas luteida TaxID=2878685 RepID=UPI001E313DC6|nr:error-prone DNA polymerase [Luteimonas sp. BDR2-5]MCD9026952.1 error-prone DNA polymerase [Luteimonas sp. BDR2-5]